ncbi:thymidylate synthase [Microbulbifer sp. CAU 1566]|uniref:thymidylate synthase n=1 Tax=Microbulbifer sp. CAU 1566 TaxID=2933269 RepID=UPI00200699B4|nr:thymidylate synthase [Microbulbifer sp. CAU 1566]
MFLSESSLDDLLQTVFTKLLSKGRSISSTRGKSTELIGVLLELKSPLSRLSRSETKGKLFSALGELLWYLSGSNDVDSIAYYLPRYGENSDDGKTIYGGYGPRIFRHRGHHDQLRNVIELLKRKSSTRRAVIQLFDGEDLSEHHTDIPCTCTLQFFVRQEMLHLHVNMRSNDAFRGLPHDIFAFTFLQEIVARTLKVKVGTYKHSVGSLHLYDEDEQKAVSFIDEGFQSNIPMPPMPTGDPWSSIKVLLDVEGRIRSGEKIDIEKIDVGSYWKDLIILLLIFREFKAGGGAQVISYLKNKLSSKIYVPYIVMRERILRDTMKQRELFEQEGT